MDNCGDGGEQRPRFRSGGDRWAVAGLVFMVLLLVGMLGVLAWKAGWLSDLNPFSGSSTPIQTSIEPTASSGELLPAETYKWRYDGQDFELTMQIPEYLYLYYSQMKRAPVEDYSIYVTHPKDDEQVTGPLAAELKKLAVQRRYDAVETVNFAASFVQNLGYRAESGEYPNYPVETLVGRGGDCEDTAILAAALLQAMGYDAVLIRYTSPIEGEPGHMAVGVAVTGASGRHSYVHNGKTYYYLETTSPSWVLGDMPTEVLTKFQGKNDGIYDLVPAPALRFSGKLGYSIERRWFSDATADITVNVTNWGTASASGFCVRAYFEGREGSAKSSATYDLASGYQISGVVVEGLVMPPEMGRLTVELWLGGQVVDSWVADIS